MNIFHKGLGHRLSTATEIFLHDLYLAKLTDINRNGVQITKTVSTEYKDLNI